MNWRDKLVSNLREVWRHWSTWTLGVILFAPDIYNGAASMGLFEGIPQGAKYVFRGLALAGLAAKCINQSSFRRDKTNG